uniref:glycosyltransferase n=1 Tax=Desulfovibrio piger TaxID=901 RepID=UPI00307F1037
MKESQDLLKKALQFTKERKYNKAKSCYALFKILYPELADIVIVNETFLRKRVTAIDEDSALIMEVPVFDNLDYLIKKFWEVLLSSPYDVKIDVISGTAEHSFLLAWFSSSDILPDCNHNKQNILMSFFENTPFFDCDFYKNQYKVVSKSEDSLSHYIQIGFEEEKLPARWFDVHFTNDARIQEIICTKHEKLLSSIVHRPKISVLVPVFNNTEYLNECINSILDQTLKDIEIIIINDGSTEKNAVQILEKYAKKDKRIRLIHKKNTGYGHSMNCGLLSAKGEYIGIVESDDYITSTMYNDLYLHSNGGQIDIVKSNPSFFYGTGAERRFKKIKLCKDKETSIFAAKDFHAYFRAIPLNPIGIFKKSFLEKENIFFSETPGASFQDIGFYFKTSVTAEKIKFIDMQHYMVRRDNENSSVFAKDKFEYTVLEYKKLYEFLENTSKLKAEFIALYNLRKFFSYKFTY